MVSSLPSLVIVPPPTPTPLTTQTSGSSPPTIQTKAPISPKSPRIPAQTLRLRGRLTASGSPTLLNSIPTSSTTPPNISPSRPPWAAQPKFSRSPLTAWSATLISPVLANSSRLLLTTTAPKSSVWLIQQAADSCG